MVYSQRLGIVSEQYLIRLVSYRPLPTKSSCQIFLLQWVWLLANKIHLEGLFWHPFLHLHFLWGDILFDGYKLGVGRRCKSHKYHFKRFFSLKALHFPLLVIEFDFNDSVCRCGSKYKHSLVHKSIFLLQSTYLTVTHSNPQTCLFVKTCKKGADASDKPLKSAEERMEPQMKQILNMKLLVCIVLKNILGKHLIWKLVVNLIYETISPSSGCLLLLHPLYSM